MRLKLKTIFNASDGIVIEIVRKECSHCLQLIPDEVDLRVSGPVADSQRVTEFKGPLAEMIIELARNAGPERPFYPGSER